MEVVSQIGLKPPKSFIKTTVIGILSLKTTNTWLFDNSGDRTWQPLLVSSQPILDFLEPWVSHVIFFFFFFGQSGEASLWKVCYQPGLPRLI